MSKLEETEVESASRRGFLSLPDLSKAISELTVLKGVGPATASAVLAAYAPHVAPFMSDEVIPLDSCGIGISFLSVVGKISHMRFKLFSV